MAGFLDGLLGAYKTIVETRGAIEGEVEIARERGRAFIREKRDDIKGKAADALGQYQTFREDMADIHEAARVGRGGKPSSLNSYTATRLSREFAPGKQRIVQDLLREAATMGAEGNGTLSQAQLDGLLKKAEANKVRLARGVKGVAKTGLRAGGVAAGGLLGGLVGGVKGLSNTVDGMDAGKAAKRGALFAGLGVGAAVWIAGGVAAAAAAPFLLPLAIAGFALGVIPKVLSGILLGALTGTGLTALFVGRQNLDASGALAENLKQAAKLGHERAQSKGPSQHKAQDAPQQEQQQQQSQAESRAPNQPTYSFGYGYQPAAAASAPAEPLAQAKPQAAPAAEAKAAPASAEVRTPLIAPEVLVNTVIQWLSSSKDSDARSVSGFLTSLLTAQLAHGVTRDGYIRDMIRKVLPQRAEGEKPSVIEALFESIIGGRGDAAQEATAQIPGASTGAVTSMRNARPSTTQATATRSNPRVMKNVNAQLTSVADHHRLEGYGGHITAVGNNLNHQFTAGAELAAAVAAKAAADKAAGKETSMIIKTPTAGATR